MSEVQKDTYQEEYDAAMAQLEAGEQPTTSADKKEETLEDQEQQQDNQEDLGKKVEKLEKALKDTQRWGHKNANDLAALRKEREEQQRAANRPAILDDNPGLEDAIRHVATPNHQEQDKNAQLIGTLEKSLPELDGLLDEEDFKKSFLELRKDSIETWLDDPLSAIRDINALQTQYQRDKAVSQAKKDFEAKNKKLDSMSIPGGSGGKGMSQEVDAAKEVWNMSKADFDKQRAKVMGY